MRIKIFQKLITLIVVITFFWSNFVWADGLSTHLAPSTALPVLYSDAQVPYIALDVLHTLSSEDMGDIKVFYEKEIEEKIRKGGKDLRCFGIRDMNGRKGKWAFYVIDLYKNEITRYLSGKDVKDRFFHVLETIEPPELIEAGEYKKFRYKVQRFTITPPIRRFLDICLSSISAYPKKLDLLDAEEKKILALYPEEISWVREHAERVARLAEIMAGRTMLGDELIRAIRLTALSHDLGKGSSPDMIRAVNNPDRVKADIIRGHGEESLRALERAGFVVDDVTREVILNHHAPWLAKGEYARIAAEIVYIADQIDASQDIIRPYEHTITDISALQNQLKRHYEDGKIKKFLYKNACELLGRARTEFTDVIYEARGSGKTQDGILSGYEQAVKTIEALFSRISYMEDSSLFSLFLAQTPVTPGWFNKAKEENRWEEILWHVADSSFLDSWYLKRLRSDGKIDIDNGSLRRLIFGIENTRAVIRAQKSEDLGWVKRAAPELADKNLAYLSPEAKLLGGLKSLMSGGLGVLAGELLVGFGDIGMNTFGVSLLFKEAIVQKIDAKGNQIMHEVPVDYSVLPIKDTGMVLDIDIGSKEPVKAKVWELRDGQARVFLLDTDIEGNSSVFRAITKVLYGGNGETPKIRMKQNIVLGRGAILAFEKMGIPIGFLHLNEAHTVISAYDLQKKRDNPLFRDTKIIFTTHTPVEFGLPKFEENLGRMIDPDTNRVREYFYRGNKLDFAHAALKMADVVNAVSQEHRDVTVRRWAQDYRDSLIAITNGVNVPCWQMPGIDAQLRGATPIDESAQLRGATPKADAKRELLEEVKKRTGVELNEDVFTIVISRRITGYKRTSMILKDLDRIAGIINASDKPVQIVFSGNSHPKDRGGQDMIKKIVDVMGQDKFKGKIVFVPNYNVEFAKLAVRGADVWLSNPEPEEEACATSYAKALKNGTILISTYTGGPMEHMTGLPLDFDPQKFDEANFKASGFFIQPYNLDTLYKCIEKARDLYYEYPLVWHKMMENALKSEVEIRDVSRVYARNAFLVSLLNNKFKEEVEISGMNPAPRQEVSVHKGGSEDPEVTVRVKSGGIKPEYLSVNIFYGPEWADSGWKFLEMKLDSEAEGVYLYKARIPVSSLPAGRYSFTTKVSLMGLKENAFTKWHSRPGNDGVIVVNEGRVVGNMGEIEPQGYRDLRFVVDTPMAGFNPAAKRFDIEGTDVNEYLDKRLSNIGIESNISAGQIRHTTIGKTYNVKVRISGISANVLRNARVMVRSNIFSFDEAGRYFDNEIVEHEEPGSFLVMSKRDRELKKVGKDSWEIDIPCNYYGNFYLTIYVVDTVTDKRIWLGGNAHLTVFPEWIKDASVAVTSLRHMREKDPENRDRLGTFTDLVWDIREKAEQGFNALLLLPLTAPVGNSPYEQLSPYALNPEHIDWTRVEDGPKVLPRNKAEARQVLEQLKQNTAFAAWLSEQQNKGVLRDFLEYAKIRAAKLMDKDNNINSRARALTISKLVKKGSIGTEEQTQILALVFAYSNGKLLEFLNLGGRDMAKLSREEIGRVNHALGRIGLYYSHYFPILSKFKLEFISEHVRARDILFKALSEYTLYEQFIAQRQLREALEAARSLGVNPVRSSPIKRDATSNGVNILFDQPFFQSTESAFCVFHPEAFSWIERERIRYALWVQPGQVEQHWYGLAKWNLNGDLEQIVKPLKYWLDFGFGGFRWDAVHYGNYKLWKLLRNKYLQGKPVFPLGEQLGGSYEAWHNLDGLGYITYEGTEFFGFSLRTLEDALIHANKAPCFVTSDTHDSPRLYELFKNYFEAGLGKDPDPVLVNKAMLTEYAFASSVFCMMSGSEYGDKKRINQPGAVHDWKGPSSHAEGVKRGDLREYMQKLNKLRHTHPAMKAHGNLIRLDNNLGNAFRDGGGISTLARVHPIKRGGVREKGSLVLVNNLSGFRQKIKVDIPFAIFRINPQMTFSVRNIFTGEIKEFITAREYLGACSEDESASNSSRNKILRSLAAEYFIQEEGLVFDLAPGENVILEFMPQPVISIEGWKSQLQGDTALIQSIDGLSTVQLHKLIYGSVKWWADETFSVKRFNETIYNAAYAGLMGLKFLFDAVNDIGALNYHVERGDFCNFLTKKVLIGEEFHELRKWFYDFKRISGSTDEKRIAFQAAINMIIKHIQDNLAKKASLGEDADEPTRQLIMTSLSFVGVKPEYTLKDGQVFRDGTYIGMDAGHPHFIEGMGDWGRDTFISLPGLLIKTGRYEEAKKIILNYARVVRRGMIPNLFDCGISPRYNTIDASLWFFQAIREYISQVPNGKEILNEKVVKKYIRTGEGDKQEYTLWDILEEMIQRHVQGIEFQDNDGEIKIFMDKDDKLLAGGNPNTQLTWMDERIGGRALTPRNGKAVEINALWYNALMTMSELAKGTGREDRYTGLAGEVKDSFNRKFWYEEGGYLYDVIESEGAEAPRISKQLRPNQLFAFSIRPELVSLEKKRRALEIIRKKLWTRHGLRTLSPDDQQYRGFHERETGSYHNGTVWSWLTGAFMDAYYDVYKGNPSHNVKEEMRKMLQGLVDHIYSNHLTVAEIFNGDPPNDVNWAGTFSQAWSVAELLRISLTYLDGRLGTGVENYSGTAGAPESSRLDVPIRIDSPTDQGLSVNDSLAFIGLVNDALKYGEEEILSHDPALRDYYQNLLSKEELDALSSSEQAPRYSRAVIKIAQDLSAYSSHFYNPSRNEVEIIFSLPFVQDLLRHYEEFPLWTQAILFQRLFHELGHSFARDKHQQADALHLIQEEAELIERDIRLIKLYEMQGIQEQVTTVFQALQGRLNFRSGYYYYLLSGFASISDNYRRYRMIQAYLNFPKGKKKNILRIAKESFIAGDWTVFYKAFEMTGVSHHLLKKKRPNVEDLLKSRRGLLREGLLNGRLTPEQFVREVIGIIRQKKLLVPADVANPFGEYRLGHLFIGDMSYRDDLISRRRRTDFALLERAVSDGTIREKFAETIEVFLAMPEIRKWTSHEALEVDLAIIQIAAEGDPDTKAKIDMRQRAFSVLDKTVSLVSISSDPIETALRIAVVGNSLDLSDTAMREAVFEDPSFLSRIFETKLARDDFWKRHDFSEFKTKIEGKPRNIVYVFDNAGEDVLDFVLINELLKRGHTVTLAGKSLPSANDATADDLINLIKDPRIINLLGLENMERIRVIATGSITTDTNLARVSEEFRSAWQKADLIIFKGQGNYYTVRDYNPTKDCFFALRVKWPLEVKDRYEKDANVAEYVKTTCAEVSPPAPASALYSITFDAYGRNVKTLPADSQESSDFKSVSDLFSDPAVREFVLKAIRDIFGRFLISEEDTEGFINILLSNTDKKSDDLFSMLRDYVSGCKIKRRLDYYTRIKFKWRINRIKRHIKGPVVADIGCGTGGLAEQIVRGIEGVEKVIATDVSVYHTITDPRIEFRKQEFACSIPIESGTVDTVVLSFMLHHVDYYNHERILKEIFRILKPGGRVVVLEDTYSDIIKPTEEDDLLRQFLKLDPLQRKMVMSFNDLLGTKVYIGYSFNVPFAYRSMEEWSNIFKRIGFISDTENSCFMGIPKDSFHSTTRGMFVLEKPDGKCAGISHNEQYMTDALSELVGEYGPGIISGMKQADIVDRDGPCGSQADGKAEIDIDVFRNKNLVKEVVEHEALHEILGLIIPDKPGLAEVVATWYSARRFLKLGAGERDEIINLLKDSSNGLDPDGRHAKFLESIEGIASSRRDVGARNDWQKAQGDEPTSAGLLRNDGQSEDDLIKACADYVKADLEVEAVKRADENLRQALKLLNELLEAGRLVSEVRETEKQMLRVIRTFGEPRIVGKCSDKVRKLIGLIARHEKWDLPQGADVSKERYIIYNPKRMPEDLRGLMHELHTKYNIVFVDRKSNVPAEANVVALVDPEDAGDWNDKTMRYLSLPYMALSLKMAVSMVLDNAEVEKGSPIYNFVKNYYEILLGRVLSKDEVMRLFSEPCWILPEIKDLDKDIGILREAIRQLDKNA